MRLVYFGSGAFGLPTLQTLAQSHDIRAVVTQPDKPAGRGSKLTPTPIGQWAAEHLSSIPLLKPARVNTPEMITTIRGFEADAWVVIAFGQKLPKALLEGRFAINLHASLLPRWRGAAPINAALLAGDTITGNSVITLADRMDAGLVLGTSERAVEPLMTAGELHDLLATDGPALVQRVLREHAEGTLRPVSQDENLVTIATKLSKSDGTPDFNQPADFLRRQIHALTPWPSVTAQLDLPAPTGPLTLKLLRAAVEPSTATTAEHAQPGTLVDASKGLIACGHNSLLRLIDVQPAGKRPMPWSDFARGRQIPPMTTLSPVQEVA